ncbi:probable glucan endo-1,3-beta-glucosidase BG1 [Gossypium hirsutum]|uniref:glucan endo-1,3-beta-D-glucosidase n=1 Tax=Gossypium hirsutum TaxID=3635 RepID=A0A1U8PVY4_GOSHI|nr:probable glucan endo-1,3-beta-glucosidase BG1 [Gossypium hirsutum]
MEDKINDLYIENDSIVVCDGRDIGVCYGLNGTNLPSPNDVINLYKTCQIDNIKIYEPFPQVLEALRESGISVAIGPRNEDIDSLAVSQDAANAWVNTNIIYKNDVLFKWITIKELFMETSFMDYHFHQIQQFSSFRLYQVKI